MKTTLRQILTLPHRVRGAQVDPSAYISPKAVIREHKHLALGAHCTVGRGVEIVPQGGQITIGTHCSLNNHVTLYGAGGITIGNDCRLATGALLAAFNHGVNDLTTPIRRQPVTAQGIVLGDDVWIGAHAIITDGVTVSSGSVIGAGSVVTRDVEPLSIVAGNPARLIRRRGI